MKVKVLEVRDSVTVPTGKKVQDVVVGDSTCTGRYTLWESDIGQLAEGKSYHLKRFMVKEYESKNYLSKGQEALISTIEDIGNTATFEETMNKSMTITEAQIVGVQQLDKYKSCLRCKVRVEPQPLDSGCGRCSKENCQMLQKYDVCPDQFYAKLMLLSKSSFVSLYEYGKALAGAEGSEVTEEMLHEAPAFTSVD